MVYNSFKIITQEVFPQVKKLDNNYDLGDPDYQSNLSYDKISSTSIKFSKYCWCDRAIRTDFVSEGGGFGGVGILVSNSVKQLLENGDFILPPHKFHPIDLFSSEGFYWLQLIWSREIINFSKSQIVLKKHGKIKEELNIKNVEEVDEVNKRKRILERVSYKELYITTSYDLFFLPNIYPMKIMSKNLVDAIKSKKLTGLEFNEVPQIKLDTPLLM